jgi:hypothetical protein
VTQRERERERERINEFNLTVMGTKSFGYVGRTQAALDSPARSSTEGKRGDSTIAMVHIDSNVGDTQSWECEVPGNVLSSSVIGVIGVRL